MIWHKLMVRFLDTCAFWSTPWLIYLSLSPSSPCQSYKNCQTRQCREDFLELNIIDNSLQCAAVGKAQFITAKRLNSFNRVISHQCTVVFFQIWQISYGSSIDDVTYTLGMNNITICKPTFDSFQKQETAIACRMLTGSDLGIPVFHFSIGNTLGI